MSAPHRYSPSQVLFVPTARLEFRITEFSWRDIPYFMYKRSEATAHGTRDYLKAKWQASFFLAHTPLCRPQKWRTLPLLRPNSGALSTVWLQNVAHSPLFWQANFPNTGFWTYIKYTIVEQHVFNHESLAELAWKDQAALLSGVSRRIF